MSIFCILYISSIILIILFIMYYCIFSGGVISYPILYKYCSPFCFRERTVHMFIGIIIQVVPSGPCIRGHEDIRSIQSNVPDHNQHYTLVEVMNAPTRSCVSRSCSTSRGAWMILVPCLCTCGSGGRVQVGANIACASHCVLYHTSFVSTRARGVFGSVPPFHPPEDANTFGSK